MTIAFICWESWLTFPVNCFVILRNGTRMLIPNAIPETLTFGSPESRNSPPTVAMTTYSTFPIFMMIGPSIFAYAFAR